MKRDETKQMADHALQELRQELKAGRSETLLRFLEVMSRFHRYSWNNCLLIMTQMPQAGRVAGFHRWLQLGRHVRKGEKGMVIADFEMAVVLMHHASKIGDLRGSSVLQGWARFCRQR